MKRSEINEEIRLAMNALEKISFFLPPFAYWPPSKWDKVGSDYNRIKKNGLGWDVTDFGSGDFLRVGAVIFTLRNGNYDKPKEGTPYGEKVIVLKPEQEIPFHFHKEKTEDIINRGGGILMMELYNPKDRYTMDYDNDVEVYCDSVRRTIKPGSMLELAPGESITLTPGIFHRFWAKKGCGTLVCGEVSSINDDRTDNYFVKPTQRFSDIVEDEEPIHLLCNEYYR